MGFEVSSDVLIHSPSVLLGRESARVDGESKGCCLMLGEASF